MVLDSKQAFTEVEVNNFIYSEVNSAWLITSELANQRVRKGLFTCVVYTKNVYYLASWGINLTLRLDKQSVRRPNLILSYIRRRWKRGGLMVSALVSGASGLGSSPGRGHCIVFLGKTLNSTVPLSTQVYQWVPANSM